MPRDAVPRVLVRSGRLTWSRASLQTASSVRCGIWNRRKCCKIKFCNESSATAAVSGEFPTWMTLNNSVVLSLKLHGDVWKQFTAGGRSLPGPQLNMDELQESSTIGTEVEVSLARWFSSNLIKLFCDNLRTTLKREITPTTESSWYSAAFANKIYFTFSTEVFSTRNN